MLSMCCIGDLTSLGTVESLQEIVKGGLWLHPRAGQIPYLGIRMLPLRPIWPSFAVNTIFYATILWLLIPGPFALSRLVRRRRGLCPACAYPMGESPTCSECGKPLPGRAEAAA